MVILWMAIAIVTLTAYVFLVVKILPKKYLREGFLISTSPDRGLRNVKEKNGRSIVYEPTMKIRKYIKQYILSNRHGKKILICKIDENLRFLNYDVVMFDRNDKVFKVLNVKEVIARPGYTKRVELDDDTSYVTLVVKEADKKKFPVDTVTTASTGNVLKYVLLGGLATFVAIVLLAVCCVLIFGGIYSESFFYSIGNVLFLLIIGGVALFIFLMVTLYVVKSKRTTKDFRGDN